MSWLRSNDRPGTTSAASRRPLLEGICLETNPAQASAALVVQPQQGEPAARAAAPLAPLELAALLDAGFEPSQIARLEFVRWKMTREERRRPTTHTVPVLWEAEFIVTLG